jgi:hypothetical protein
VDVQQVIKELVFKTIHKPLLTALFFWDMILGQVVPNIPRNNLPSSSKVVLRTLEDECKVLLHNIKNALN